MSNPSRFVRGRGRGGGPYRPYFYFRRGGRVIPAGGEPGAVVADHNPSSWGSNRRARGGRRRGPAANANLNNSTTANELESTFLRPEHFAAPEGALNINNITAFVPTQCPGWRLYFLKEDYSSSSELAKRIKLMEVHFNSHFSQYDLTKIFKKSYFTLQACTVLSDAQITTNWPTLSQDLQMRPQQTLAILGCAMYTVVSGCKLDVSVDQEVCRRDLYVGRNLKPRKIYVRPTGFAQVKSIQSIENCEIDTLCAIQGTVVAIGSVEAPATWISFTCPRCKLEQAMRQTGVQVSRPYGCKNNECPAKKGFIEQRSSPFTRLTAVQIVRLVETTHTDSYESELEDATHFDVEVRHDLVDSISPGQNVIITGIPKMHPLADAATHKSDVFKIYFKALSIVDVKQEERKFSERDLNHIAAINGESDCLKLLVNSIAPEVHGQEMAKAGVLLSLFGGSGSQLHDEGDIHVLLVGDPGIGKSHTLQMCAKVTDKGTTISGKGNNTNKLITSIQGRHQSFLQSGAIVSSSNGLCTIDDIDRLAAQQESLLQVMQSRIISIPFASIFTTITTPASIIATANPTRAHYDHSKFLTENIRITPTLLSEFHLVFVLTDKPSRNSDAALTEHVRAMHEGAKKSSTIAARFAGKPKINNSMSSTFDDSKAALDELGNYNLEQRLKMDPFEQMELLPVDLIKKFIAYARKQVRPLLSVEAAKILKKFYMQLRQDKIDEKYGSYSTSQLEGLIRLAQARARMSFSSAVTVEHVRDIMCIVKHSIEDTAIGDYVDLNPAGARGGGSVAGMSKNKQAKRFIEALQQYVDSSGRKMLDMDELKELAEHIGINSGLTGIIDMVNMQGLMLKKGPNMFEVMMD